MNYKSTKALSAYATGIQVITIVIAYLLYANQETVKKLFSGSEEVARVHTIPVAYFVVCICPAVFYFLYVEFQALTEGKEDGRKAGSVIFFVLACLMEIVLGYIPGIETMLIGKMGVSQLASYSVLGNAISACIRPFSIVAFGLFALSVGGNLFMQKSQEKIKVMEM